MKKWRRPAEEQWFIAGLVWALGVCAVYHGTVFADLRRWPTGPVEVWRAAGTTVAWLCLGGVSSLAWAGWPYAHKWLAQRRKMVLAGSYAGFALMVAGTNFLNIRQTGEVDFLFRPGLIVLGFLAPLANLAGQMLLVITKVRIFRDDLHPDRAIYHIVATGLGLAVLGQVTCLAFPLTMSLLTWGWKLGLGWAPITMLVLLEWRFKGGAHARLGAIIDEKPTPHPLSHETERGCGVFLRTAGRANGRGASFTRTYGDQLLQACTCACLLLGLGLCLVPPVETDELRYHLPAVSAYLEHNQLVKVPYSAFTNFPFLVEMLFAWPMALGCDRGAKVVHWLFYALTAGLIQRWVLALGLKECPRYARSIAWLAALGFASLPVAMVCSSWAIVDLSLAFYILLAVWAVLTWIEAAQSDERHLALACITGIAAGAAMGVKLTGLIPAGLIFGIFGWGVWRQAMQGDKTSRIAPLLVFSLSAALMAVPWWVRAWSNTGDPVFPLLYQWFHTPDWNSHTQAFYQYHSGLKGGLNAFRAMPWTSRLADLISLPWRQVLQPEQFGNNPLGPWPLAALGLALLAWLKTRSEKLLGTGLIALFLWLFWACTYRDNRFALPVMALGAVVGAQSLLRLVTVRSLTGLEKVLGGSCLAWALSINFTQALPAWQADQAFILGRKTHEEFLTANLDYYPAAKLARQHASARKTLVVGFEQAYYFHNAIVSDYFDLPGEVRLAKTAGSVAELDQLMRGLNVSVVAHHRAHLARQPGVLWRYLLHFLDPEEAVRHLTSIAAATTPPVYEAAVNAAITAAQTTPAWQRFDEWLNSGVYLQPIAETAGVALYQLPEKP